MSLHSKTCPITSMQTKSSCYVFFMRCEVGKRSDLLNCLCVSGEQPTNNSVQLHSTKMETLIVCPDDKTPVTVQHPSALSVSLCLTSLVDFSSFALMMSFKLIFTPFIMSSLFYIICYILNMLYFMAYTLVVKHFFLKIKFSCSVKLRTI